MILTKDFITCKILGNMYYWPESLEFIVNIIIEHVVLTSYHLITGNGLSIAVLYRQDMDLKPVFKQILITLISFDTFCIVFNLLLFCFSHLSDYYYDNIFPYIVPHILPLAQIALTGKNTKRLILTKYQLTLKYCKWIIINLKFIHDIGSIYSTLAVAIERYTSVCHPHYTPSHCAGSFSISALVIFSVAFNICRFLEFETTYSSEVINLICILFVRYGIF